MLTLRSIVPALALITLFVAAPTLHAQERVDTLIATLSGEDVVGEGDEDGTGTATFRLEPDTDRVCYDLQVFDITEATAAHVHQGPAEQDGPPVITLSAPRGGTSSDCTTVDGALITRILEDPAAFYVNVHNPDYPAGAVRGQLAPR